MATVIGGPWPEHLNSPANTCYQTRPVMTMTSSLVTTHWGRVRLVRRTCYPALAWLIQFRACAMPSVPVPPIMSLWGFSGGGARTPARSVCLVTLSPSEAGPGRFGRQASVTDICHAMPSGHVRAPHSRFRANLGQPSAPNKRLAIVYRFSVTMGAGDVTASMLSAPKQLHHAPRKSHFLDADQTMPRACRCGIACGSALGTAVRTDPGACIACALHSGAFPHA